MEIEVSCDPVFHVVVKNALGKENNKNIFDETLSFEKSFVKGRVGNNTEEQKIRSNDVLYYDDIKPHGELSGVLQNKDYIRRYIANFIKNPSIIRLLTSSQNHKIYSSVDKIRGQETQVSRYGNDEQFYSWHVDNGPNTNRSITAVYYFFNEPKRFEGGNLKITNSPILNDKIFDNYKVKEINIENDMLVIFPSNVSHSVTKTTSPKKFEDGRFSINCWLHTENRRI